MVKYPTFARRYFDLIQKLATKSSSVPAAKEPLLPADQCPVEAVDQMADAIKRASESDMLGEFMEIYQANVDCGESVSTSIERALRQLGL
ncbi:MAG: hypothetical protein ACR2QF_02140 [Geminicoccaceae bacterium]